MDAAKCIAPISIERALCGCQCLVRAPSAHPLYIGCASAPLRTTPVADAVQVSPMAAEAKTRFPYSSATAWSVDMAARRRCFLTGEVEMMMAGPIFTAEHTPGNAISLTLSQCPPNQRDCISRICKRLLDERQSMGHVHPFLVRSELREPSFSRCEFLRPRSKSGQDVTLIDAGRIFVSH